MAKAAEKLRPATGRLARGALLYEFPPESGLTADDSVQAFVGDHLIGSAQIETGPKNSAHAAIQLAGIGHVEFPCELRGVLVRTGDEIALPVRIADALTLMRLVGMPKVEASLSAIRDDAVSFDLVIATLPGFPRQLELRVSNDQPTRAISRPNPREVGLHEVTFPIRTMLRDGDYLELADVATDSVLHGFTATWLNLMEPLRKQLKHMEARQNAISLYLDQTRARLEALANVSRDRQFLERLDLYYYLLNDRLDRELRWLDQRNPEADQTDAAPPRPEDAEPTQIVHARSLEGVGVYELESNGSSDWRWFSPQVMLVLRDVGENLSGLSLVFTSLAPGVKLADLEITANGMTLVSDAKGKRQDHHELVMATPSGLVRRDRSLLINLRFAQGHTPDGDQRLLAAAFVQAELFYG